MVTALEQQTAFINNYYETVWVQKNLARCKEFFNENAKFTSPLGDVRGIDAIEKHFQRFQEALPDLKLEIIDIIAQNNKVVCRVRLKATCGKNFFGINGNQKPVNYEIANFFTLENNKIQDCWVLADMYTLLTQIGTIPQVIKPTHIDHS